MRLDFSNTRIFIKPGSTDLRKAATGLSYIVRDEMNLRVLDGSVFLFCNKSRKLLKALWWDKTGFWLAQKNLSARHGRGRTLGKKLGKYPRKTSTFFSKESTSGGHTGKSMQQTWIKAFKLFI